MPAMVARLTSSAIVATPLMLTFAVQTAAMGAPIGAWEKSSTDSVVALLRLASTPTLELQPDTSPPLLVAVSSSSPSSCSSWKARYALRTPLTCQEQGSRLRSSLLCLRLGHAVDVYQAEVAVEAVVGEREAALLKDAVRQQRPQDQRAARGHR